MSRKWSHHASKPMDLDDYTEQGTNHGAIAVALNDHPQSLYEGLSPMDREWTRKLFRCLTTIEKGREVRRPKDIGHIYQVVGADSAADQEAVLRIIRLFASDEHSLLVTTSGASPENEIVDISHESLIRKWHQLKQWTKDEADSAEWLFHLFRDTERRTRGEAGYWTDPELSTALARRDRDGWTAAWAEQYRKPDWPAFSEVQAFLGGSRAKQRSLKRTRALVATSIVLLLAFAVTAVVQRRAAEQRSRVAEEQRRAAEERLRLAEEQRRVALLEMNDLLQKLRTAPAADRPRIQDDISAILSKVQAENVDLKSKVASLDKQLSDLQNQNLPEALRRQLTNALPKAQEYDALTARYGDLREALGQLDALKRDREDLRAELASRKRELDTPITTRPLAVAIRVEIPEKTAKEVADTRLVAVTDGVLLGRNVYLLAGQGSTMKTFSNDDARSYASVLARLKAALKSCDGHSAKVPGPGDDVTAWCFKVDFLRLNAYRPLGQVRMENIAFNVHAVGVDERAHTVEIELRPAQ